jgi:RHS repeat-associated protein
MSCSQLAAGDPRYVGDPVDVTTGANVDVALDFRLPGVPTFLWRRYYNSSHHQWHRPLGWGHSHEYDHSLWLHVDGVRYTGPAGVPIEFAGALRIGDVCASGAHTLTRAADSTFVLRHLGSATELVFRFAPRTSQAPIAELRSGAGTLRFYYGPHGLAEIAHSDGRHVVVSTDELGRVRALTLGARGARDARHLMTYDYDEAGNLARGRDPYGSTFSFSYDVHHRVVRRTNRSGYSMVFAYDGDGRCNYAGGEDGVSAVALRYRPLERCTEVTEADGGEWRYFYDERGQVTQVLNPAGGARRILYDDAGRRASELDPLGNETRYVRGEDGELLGKISPIGIVYGPDEPSPPPFRPHTLPKSAREYEYGAHAPKPERRRGRASDPAATWLLTAPLQTEIVRTRRDEFGKLLTESTRSGASRHWGYDANGNMVRHRDFSGAEYRVQYASWNHRVRDVGPEGHEVHAWYTPTERPAAIRDAGGAVHQYRYTLLGRVAEVYRHGELLETHDYDCAGNRTMKRDRAGRPLLRFEIAPGNQIAARHLASGDVQQFEYDDQGRMLRAASQCGAVEFAYDDEGRRTKDLRDGQGVETRHDGVDREVAVLGRFHVRYRVRRDGTLRITDPTGATHVVGALAHGVIYRECANGSSEHTRFDSEGRVHARIHQSARAGGRKWIRTYHWSEDGDLLQVQDSRAGTTSWSYDRTHRLRAAALPNGAREDFAYDGAGNLLRAPGLSDVVLQSGNRLAWANGDQFEYDDRDHLATRTGAGGTRSYAYDSRGLLTRIAHDGLVAWESTYDALGRRTSKTVPVGRTHYYWSTDQLAAEVDPAGRLRVYVYVDALALTPFMFVDYASVDADPESGAAYFVFSNHLGAPLAVEDSAGRTVWRCTYAAYGAAAVDPASRIAYHLRFPGHYFDAETGLHYNRFRYYSPELGRYLQSDPHGISGGLNLYAYTRNPLVQVDIRGLNCGGHGKGAKAKPDCEDCLDADPDLAEALSPTAPGAIMSPEELRAEVARREALLRTKLSQDERGPCVSMVLDQETGQAFPGLNQDAPPPRTPEGQTPQPGDLHPLLADRIDNPPEGGWRNPDPPGSHSEINALNDALWQREANRGTQPPGSLTDTNGLLIDNQRSRGANKGTPMPCCPNCTHITGDVPSQAGKDAVGPMGGGGGGPGGTTDSTGVPTSGATDSTGVPTGGASDHTGVPAGGGSDDTGIPSGGGTDSTGDDS